MLGGCCPLLKPAFESTYAQGATSMSSFVLDSAANDPSRDKEPIGVAAGPEFAPHTATHRGDESTATRLGQAPSHVFCS